MPITIPEMSLREAVADIYNDAITYFRLRAEDAVGSQEKFLATMKAKEFATGRDMLDLLLHEDGETFLVSEAADTVTQSLVNFYAVLDRRDFPLMSWRVMDALMRSRNAERFREGEGEGHQEEVLH
jgi:hypothetical protein